ncbi:MAG: 50S ribosomal protein L29 [Nanoarchaeota archaeon]|jgi:ribosomal protein L29
MKAKDIQKLTVKEMQEKLRELQSQLTKERAQVARGTQSKNPMLIKNTRKAIARIMQLLATKKEVEVATKA